MLAGLASGRLSSCCPRRGGADAVWNMQWLTREANRKKGDYGMLTTAIKLSAVLVLLGASPVAAEMVERSIKLYGNCFVATDLDAMTDEVSHMMMCAEPIGDMSLEGGFLNRLRNELNGALISFSTQLAIRRTRSDKLGLMLRSEDISFSLDERPTVKLRVDREGVWIEKARAGDNGQSWLIPNISRHLLTEIANGKKLTFRVGKITERVPLRGSARALADLLGRGFNE